jgi:hypothetical protein
LSTCYNKPWTNEPRLFAGIVLHPSFTGTCAPYSVLCDCTCCHQYSVRATGNLQSWFCRLTQLQHQLLEFVIYKWKEVFPLCRVSCPQFLQCDSASMYSVLWRLISILVLLIPLTTCAIPEPQCSVGMGGNPVPKDCLEAIRQFDMHKDEFLRPYNLVRPYEKQCYFSNHAMATSRGSRQKTNVLLPLGYSYGSCSITVRMPDVVEVDPVPASWSRLSNAIMNIYRRCVNRPFPRGGFVEYYGLVITIQGMQ